MHSSSHGKLEELIQDSQNYYKWAREEEEEEEFITSGNWRGKHNSLSRGAGADPP